MATTNYSPGTVIASDWLNDVDAHAYDQVTGSHAAENVSFKQTGSSVTTSVGAKLNEIVSVKDFGAVGDGVTNDTAAFAAAMAAIASAGGTLVLEKATYLLNGGTASADGYKNGVLAPFLQANPDATKRIVVEGNGAVLKCGANSMVLFRVSRNDVELRNLTLDYNGKTSIILCGVVPEDMTQTTTLVSQQHVTLTNVDRIIGSGVDGLVFQPGPAVGASDSGCFYHNVFGGVSNAANGDGGRHVHFKKNANWATRNIKNTRINFYGHKCLRGNAGYHGEAVAELLLSGCNEELIDDTNTPLTTPTARYFTNDCANVQFVGGYSEACSASVEGFTVNGVVSSFGYVPASGGLATFKPYVDSYADGVNEGVWTPVLNSSGGGAEGAGSSSGYWRKQGKVLTFSGEINVAKGTLAAGNLSVSGLPFVVRSSGPGLSTISANWSGLTLAANYTHVGAIITGATITLRKNGTAGVNTSNLTLGECGDPVQITFHGSYVTA